MIPHHRRGISRAIIEMACDVIASTPVYSISFGIMKNSYVQGSHMRHFMNQDEVSEYLCNQGSVLKMLI